MRLSPALNSKRERFLYFQRGGGILYVPVRSENSTISEWTDCLTYNREPVNGASSVSFRPDKEPLRVSTCSIWWQQLECTTAGRRTPFSMDNHSIGLEVTRNSWIYQTRRNKIRSKRSADNKRMSKKKTNQIDKRFRKFAYKNELLPRRTNISAIAAAPTRAFRPSSVKWAPIISLSTHSYNFLHLS